MRDIWKYMFLNRHSKTTSNVWVERSPLLSSAKIQQPWLTLQSNQTGKSRWREMEYVWAVSRRYIKKCACVILPHMFSGCRGSGYNLGNLNSGEKTFWSSIWHHIIMYNCTATYLICHLCEIPLHGISIFSIGIIFGLNFTNPAAQYEQRWKHFAWLWYIAVSVHILKKMHLKVQ